MPELNCDTPIVYTLLRERYLYNGDEARKGLIPCAIFGASSIQGRAIGFHAMLHNGALIYRLPISAFCVRECEELPLHHLELWDCFSHHITCTEYMYLRGLRADVILRDRSKHQGIYLFTLDWYGSSLADNPGEGGHKCAHIIALQNGNYCAQPNNRIVWSEPSFIVAKLPTPCDYETNNQVWSVENKGPKWCTEDTDRMYYNLKSEEPTDGRKA